MPVCRCNVWKMTMTVFMVVLLFVFCHSVRANTFDDAPLRYSKGVYELPEPPSSSPLIYDNFFPIIYELHLPKWNLESMKIQFWKNHNNCSLTDNYNDGYPCPIIYHMNHLLEYFIGNMTQWKNLFLDNIDDNTPSHIRNQNNPDLEWPLLFSRSKSQAIDMKSFCGQIAPHFSTFQTSAKKMTEYYKLIESCTNDTVKLSKDLSSTAKTLENMYHETFSSFVADYWSKQTKIAQETSATTIWTALESTLMIHQFMETQKWTSAISSCQQGQIPWSIIDHDSITDEIESSPHSDNYKLAIPVTEMSKYYKLPLTDCVFVGQDTLVVRILIPRISTELQPFRILKLEPIVFHQNEQFCWIKDIRNKRFIADSEDNLYNTECSGNKDQGLCKISTEDYSSHDLAFPCAEALYKNAEEEIVQSCSLTCISADKRDEKHKHFNFAHTVNDTFVYAAVENESDITIECKGKDNQIVPKMDLGTWNITLACGCTLKGISSAYYQVHTPCNNEVVVEKLRPFQWKYPSKITPKVESNSVEESSPLGFEEINGANIYQQHIDERFRVYHINYMVLWVVMLFLSIVLGIIGYMVFKLHQWKQHEVYKENRLIYNVGDNDNIAMERQQSY